IAVCAKRSAITHGFATANRSQIHDARANRCDILGDDLRRVAAADTVEKHSRSHDAPRRPSTMFDGGTVFRMNHLRARWKARQRMLEPLFLNATAFVVSLSGMK